MAKKLVLMKPFQQVKVYSMALADDEAKSVAPVLFFTKSSLISDEEYVKLMSNLNIASNPNYVPELVAEVTKADETLEVKETK